MIATGGSIVGAAQVCRAHGARAIYAFATHPVLCGPAIERLREAPFDEIVVTDSIPVPPNKLLPNLRILTLAPMLGEAIRRIHRNESVSALFQ
jgi:ribose-phosphate pyrophosphokinase